MNPQQLISFFLGALASLLAIVNPAIAIPIFVALSANLKPIEGRPPCRPTNRFGPTQQGEKWDGTEAVPPKMNQFPVGRVAKARPLSYFALSLLSQRANVLFSGS
jgi:hypothetical protein